MADLRAFIGHSFGTDDAILIRKFTDYFDQVSRLVPRFSWTHAEPAEPKPLNEKVLELINDKNLFIGICSRKECTINQSKIRRLLGNWSMVDRRSLNWKTSDWIVQEIGLAIGKGLKLILLLEEGLSQPGGLQGNIEYISFNREAPELAFGKMLEMITALLPRDGAGRSVISTEISSASSPEQEKPIEQAPPEDIDWERPTPDWSSAFYEIAYMRFSRSGDHEKARRIEDAYLNTDDAKDDDNRASWEAFAEYQKITGGLHGSLSALEQLAERHRDKIDVQRYLGRAHEYYEDYQKAAQIYGSAAERGRTEPEIVDIAGSAAVAYARAGQTEWAEKILNDLRLRVATNHDCEKSLLYTIQEISKVINNEELTVAAIEGRTRLDPTDKWVRFDLAYNHSQLENNDLSLLHYLKIPPNQRTLMAWNNLGVAFNQFRLRGKSVDAFRKAAEGGDTLAMSNLAQRYLSSGFISEAQNECDRALRVPNYHKNINNMLVQVRQLADDEEDKERELLEAAKPKADFYQQFGQAITQVTAEVAGRWRGPDCVLDISVQDGKLMASGTYDKEEAANPFFLAAFGSRGTQSIRYQVTYEGTIIGRAIQARVKRIRDGTPSSSLLSIDPSHKVLMILTEGLDALQSMELSNGSQPNFYSLTRMFTDGGRG